MSNIIERCDTRPVPNRPLPYPAGLRDSGCALIIDNGSYQCRAGWAFDFAANLPQQPSLEFRNLIAKPRRDRNNRDAAIAALLPPIQVGNEITNIEAMRFQLKTQFDRNVVTHLHNTEQIFDYVLRNLGVTGCPTADAGLPHPVVLTEALANPNHSRQQMSELLFECYAVPQVAYGIDALFSFEHTHPGATDALILSFGQHTTHVIPWLRGRAQLRQARRLNLGGAQMTNYLHRLLQLKYPVHSAAISLSRAEWLLHTQGTVATDYAEALRNWSGLEYYERHVRRVQLPYAVAAARAETAASAAERTGRRREMAKRLADANAKRRDEKLAEAELLLQRLQRMRELGGDGAEFELALAQMELGSAAELEKQIQLTAAKIARTRGKIATAAAAAVAAVVAVDNAEDATRAGGGGGQPLPAAPDGLTIAEWVRQTRARRAEILERRQARRQRRQDLAKRRTAAAQERMRVISRLARKEKGNDDFGARDEDWDVYKQIRRDTGDSDSEAEQERLAECEDVLRTHDPDFERLATGGSWPGGAGSFGGFGGAGVSGGGSGLGAMLAAGHAAENPAELYQLHVGVEAIRCAEIIFQPSLVGCPEAGLAEIIEFVLRQFSADEQQAMVGNVFLTGGCSNFPGLNERLTRELREIRPFGSTFQLSAATQASQDAWLGAQQVAMDAANAGDIYVSRAEYAEKGGEYLREHRWGNQFHATPAPIVESSSEQN